MLFLALLSKASSKLDILDILNPGAAFEGELGVFAGELSGVFRSFEGPGKMSSFLQRSIPGVFGVFRAFKK